MTLHESYATPKDFKVGDVISFGNEIGQYVVVDVDDVGFTYKPYAPPRVPFVAGPPNRHQRRVAASQQRHAARRVQ